MSSHLQSYSPGAWGTGPGQPHRGAIMLVALIAIFVFIATAVAILSLATMQSREMSLEGAQLRALYVAESGIKEAAALLNQQAEQAARGTGLFEITDGQEVTGSYAWGDYTVLIEALGETEDWILTSVGTTSSTVTGTTSREVQVVMRAIQKSRAETRFAMAMFGDQFLSINGEFFADSYNTAEGSYEPLVAEGWQTPYHGSEGDLGSNGELSVTGGKSEVHGDVSAGTNLVPSYVGVCEGELGCLPGYVQLSPIPESEWQAAQASNSNADINSPHGGSGVGAGPYHSEGYSLLVGSQQRAVLGVPGGPMQTYYFENVHTSGAGIRIEIAGPSTIYVNGDWVMDGSSQLNHGGDATDLLVYGVGSGEFVINGTTGTSAGIYAPGHNLTVNGLSDLVGSFVGSSVTVNGNGAFHYDEALGGLVEGDPTPVTIGFEVGGWYEPAVSAPAGGGTPQ